ncbi:MAG: hemerythrin domain-containing protein [Euryarchaeota archaeon]|nr:hemerythrin domain-containing protein [Euryarchaeota archaeon]MBT3972047.1 hemerythrin domain-containing protein [Euryarchaeota archaeon]MBT4407061.1 hemerythrin domain-containing protein [Euryarchaeota archaeon]
MADTNDAGLRAFFSKDHSRLDSIFNKCRKNGYSNSIDLLKEFATGLIQHIIWEEEYLFPVFEQVTGMTQEGPTVIMRQEHHTIQELLYDLLTLAEKGDVDPTLPAALEGILLQHNQAEESVLYEAVDSMVTPESQTELINLLNSSAPIDLQKWLAGVEEVPEVIQEETHDDDCETCHIENKKEDSPISFH